MSRQVLKEKNIENLIVDSYLLRHIKVDEWCDKANIFPNIIQYVAC